MAIFFWQDNASELYFFYKNIIQAKAKWKDIKFDINSGTEEFVHGAKVARTVIKNWSHIQQRAVRTMSYSVSKSVENVGGNAFEFGLSASKTVGGDEYGGEVNFGFAVASGRLTRLRGFRASSLNPSVNNKPNRYYILCCSI